MRTSDEESKCWCTTSYQRVSVRVSVGAGRAMRWGCCCCPHSCRAWWRLVASRLPALCTHQTHKEPPPTLLPQTSSYRWSQEAIRIREQSSSVLVVAHTCIQCAYMHTVLLRSGSCLYMHTDILVRTHTHTLTSHKHLRIQIYASFVFCCTTYKFSCILRI